VLEAGSGAKLEHNQAMRVGWGVFFCLGAFPAWAGVETVVVTGRPPDPVGSAAFSVSEVDATELHRFGALDRALEQVPGLSEFRRNTCLSANPTTQGVSLRSIAPSGASRALVTLDGVPQNDPFGGWVLWCSLPPEDVAGAQVVRGAGAGPYGAGALTGVVALEEAQGAGLYAADASGGSIGLLHAGGAGGLQAGPVALFASASSLSTSGWNSVPPGQRGRVDSNLTVDARNASLLAAASPGDGIEITGRASLYDEGRHSGLVGETSDAMGEAASLTVARPRAGSDLGWRLQAWFRASDFSNLSDSIGAARASLTPSNDEYATPAAGWGGSAELRGEAGALDWAVGLDGRETSGNTKEHFTFVAGKFTMNRIAGGRTEDGGIYVELADRFDGFLATLGARLDEWQSANGHLLQSKIATGAITLDQRFPSRSGRLPTARAGLRHDFNGFYFRTAVYEGFRQPTLNELYRPFRLGNNVTLANATLAPETLYGAELGAGGDLFEGSWDATLFWNRLHDPVTNVTIGHGPGNFPPPAGFVPAGGLVIKRENIGDIDAFGLEGRFHYPVAPWLDANGAFDVVNARVYGGTAASQLDGKRPPEAPRWTITGMLKARPFDGITLETDVRYESRRFVDDQNTLVLPAATSVDAKASWSFAPSWNVYVAIDNLLNARIATNESANFVFNDDFPRLVRAGVQFQR